MKALVTGAAGFIGSHLCERLLTGGAEVLGVDSFAPTYDTGMRRDAIELIRLNGSFSFIEGDLATMELNEVLYDVDVVYHLAARPGVRASWDDFSQFVEANIMVTKRLLQALARSSTPPKLVFASSSSVYGPADVYPTPESTPLAPISPYGVTKASAEHLLAAYVSQYGLDAVALRYFTVYGPRQRPDMAFYRWITAALLGRPLPIYGDGNAIRDFTYVSDVVDATVTATALPPGTVANVAGGTPASIKETLDLIATLCETGITMENIDSARGDPRQTGGDTTLIRSTTGWEPMVSLEEGLRAEVEWIRSRLGR